MTGTFAWVRAKQLEIIVLNDFHSSASIIPCSDFLQMLEGDIVHLPALKRHLIHKGDAPLVLVKGGSIDQTNTQMMSVCWQFFHFWKQIPEKDQVCLAPCLRCFAKLITDIK